METPGPARRPGLVFPRVGGVHDARGVLRIRHRGRARRGARRGCTTACSQGRAEPGPATRPASPRSPPRRPRGRRGAYRRPVVLVVGDSLVQRGFETSGWVASLARVRAGRGRGQPRVQRVQHALGARAHDARTRLASAAPRRRARGDPSRRERRRAARGPQERIRRARSRVRATPRLDRRACWRGGSRHSTETCRAVRASPVDEEERLRITTERRGMPADLLDRDAERTRACAEAARRVRREVRLRFDSGPARGVPGTRRGLG